MAPVVRELHDSPHFAPLVVLTGQHASMLDQVNADFGITAHHNLEIMAVGQSLQHITSRSLDGVSRLIATERPDVVMVQGDTTSAFAAALAAFYAQVPVAHLEAGLRTDDIYSPYPEEMNRRLTTRLASLHLVPTPSQRGPTCCGRTSTGFDPGDRQHGDRLAAVDRSAQPSVRPSPAARDRTQRRARPARHRPPAGVVGRTDAQRGAGAGRDLLADSPSCTSCFPRIAIRSSARCCLPTVERGRNIDVLEPLPYPDFTRLMWMSSWC